MNKTMINFMFNIEIRKKILCLFLTITIILSITIGVARCVPVTEYIDGLKIFSDGIQIKDPNTASIDPNGLATFKNCTIKNGNLTVQDANLVTKFTVDPNGSTSISRNDIQATSTAGLTLQNTTVSTVGVPVQYSPSLNFYGTAWDTDGSSDTFKWILDAKNVSGGTTFSYLNFNVEKNGSATELLRIYNSASYSGHNIKLFGSLSMNDVLYLQSDGITSTSTDRLALSNGSSASASVPIQMSPRLRFIGKVWNTTGAGSSETSSWIMENLPVSGTTPSSLLKFGYSANGGAYSYPLTVDNSGSITAGADTDTTFTFGRGKIGYDGANSDTFAIAHYDCMSNTDKALSQNSLGDTILNAKSARTTYLRNNNSTIASITSTGLTMAAGKTITIDGLTIQAKSGALADDATITLPTGVCGILKVWSEAEHGTFYIDANGVVTFDSMSSGMDDADTDTKLCVYDGGTGGIIKNRLGSEKKIRYSYEYSTE